jgi:hypothetical protein
VVNQYTNQIHVERWFEARSLFSITTGEVMNPYPPSNKRDSGE